MFDQTFVDTHAQTPKPWTVGATLVLQTGVVALGFISPLLQVALLESPKTVPVWMPLENLKRPVEREAPPIARSAPATRPVFTMPRPQAPTTVPTMINSAPDPPAIVFASAGQSKGDTPFDAFTGVIAEPALTIPSPPNPKPALAPSAAPVRVTSGVQSAKLVFGPKPSYPPLALTTHTQGTVRIQAVIGREGTIRNLQVLSGPPLLIAVAVEAVKQWRYQPTLLNGEAVEVITEIDVNFALAR